MLPLLLLLSCTRAPSPEIRKTNVVWVVLDTLRADRLGTYGYPVPTSPVFDALSERGVLFENCYSNAPWTRPSVASMLTGRYPRSTGVAEEHNDVLDEALWTAAERFDTRGYLTIGQTANPNLNHRYGFAQGFDVWRDSGQPWPFPSAPRSQNMEPGNVVTARAIEALDRLAPELQAQPFFLFTVFIDPHGPYEPPDPHLQAMEAAGSSFPPYDGEVAFVDQQLGALIDALSTRGLMDDTLLVITADHGEGLDSYPGLPDSERHGPYLHDAVTHVPLLLVHPGLAPRRVPELVSLVDLLPTVLDLLGDPLPDTQHEGTPRTDLIRGSGAGAEYVFLETDWREYHRLGVRSDTHKLVRNDDVAQLAQGIHERAELPRKVRDALLRGEPVELYPVGSRELTSVAESEPAVVTGMLDVLSTWERTHPTRPPLMRSPEDITTTPEGPLPPAGQTGSFEADAFIQQQLEALGYVESR